MMKLKLAALFAAGAITFGGGAALAAPAQQDQAAPKAQMARRPHHSPFDKDGMITRDAWMKAAAARFERFDVNKDGKISRQELRFGRFEERMHRRHRQGWHHGGAHRGPGFGPGREGPGGPGGPHRRFGPPPAGQPAPAAPATPAPGN
ncbi:MULTISPECIES: hypothetical protein [unclassified Sphingomonas]|nr:MULTISPECIES: hypothetical protein [unclassified Sphingomonas]